LRVGKRLGPRWVSAMWVSWLSGTSPRSAGTAKGRGRQQTETAAQGETTLCVGN
jgi:hypothetical protein